MSQELEFTDANFEREVIQSDRPVLVDFWAPWCGPCRAIAPIVAEVSAEYAEKLKVGKLNTDNNQETAVRYGVVSIPTLIIFKNGKPVASIIGVGNQPKKTLVNKIDAVLAG